MVSVNNLAFCPTCDTPVSRNDIVCPVCRYRLVLPESLKSYDAPNYVYTQCRAKQKKILDDLDKSADPARDGAEVVMLMREWFRNCRPEDRTHALIDALETVKNIIYSNATTSELKSVVAIAKNIGELADAVENFHKKGGPLYGTEVGSVPGFPGDAARRSETIT